jgi:branched-chain amino acid transport system ATP-binding protein
MLVIGRGLMLEPKLLMLDEPSLGLAPILAEAVFEKLEEIRGQGIATLLVEQNVYRALTLASRGHVLENGRVVLEGNCEELLKNRYIKTAYLGV